MCARASLTALATWVTQHDTRLLGPAGAFEQEITVLHNTLFDSALCNDESERQQDRGEHARSVE
jgi:hypothetical protein